MCSHTAARDTRRMSTFYIVESWAEALLEKARFALARGGRSGHSFFMYGEKGTGNTLLVEWMAGQLSLRVNGSERHSREPASLSENVAVPSVDGVGYGSGIQSIWVDKGICDVCHVVRGTAVPAAAEAVV